MGVITNEKQRFGAALWELADLEHADSSRRSFRARAYRQAAWSLDFLSPQLDEPRDELLAVPGIGPGTASLIDEFRRTGSVARLSALRSVLPSAAFQLARLPRMTPRRLRLLRSELQVDDTADLVSAIEVGAVASLPGIGPGTAAVWIRRLSEMDLGTPIQRAMTYASLLGRHLERHVPGLTATLTGGLRRLDEHVPTVEVLAVGGRGLRRFLRQSAIVTAYDVAGDQLTLDTLTGPALVHEARRSDAGTALVTTTGPPSHLATLTAMSRSGLGSPASNEEEVYARLGEGVPPPPARGGDFPLPPGLIRPEDIRGDLHLHSDWSPDGRQSLRSIVAAARRRGLEYIAITDHAVDLGFGGLTPEDLRRQRDAIVELREENPDILILHGAELNIDRHGSLDYDDEVLAWLDFRLAAVHSFFDLPARAQTERVLRTVGHPLVHAVAHLTGRRIGIRPPIELDVEAVVAAAAEHHTALEVNGHLDRLDLSAGHVRQAVSQQAPLLADSDAHRTPELGNVANAVGVLQRARTPAGLVVNARSKPDFVNWLSGDGGRPAEVTPG